MPSVWDDPNNVATLRRMWATKASTYFIAKKIGGITRDAVIGKAGRLGLKNRVTGEKRKPYLRAEHPTIRRAAHG